MDCVGSAMGGAISTPRTKPTRPVRPVALPTSGIARVLPNLPKKCVETLPERYFSLRCLARVERGGSNNHTSPALDMRAMKGGGFLVTNRCIFGRALAIAEAISSPDILPEGRIKARAPLCMSASRSAGRLRIRSSLVRVSQPRRPTAGNHSSSRTSISKCSLSSSTLHPCRRRACAITLSPKLWSRKKMEPSGRVSVVLAADRFFDFCLRAAIVIRKSGNRLPGFESLVDNFG